MLVLTALNNSDFISLQGLSGAGMLKAMFGTSEPTTQWFSMLQNIQGAGAVSSGKLGETERRRN